jgi:phosphoribosylanthranilate isomerase
MIVKICGITTFEDALTAAEAGAHMLGLNFYPKSKRYLKPEDALLICEGVRAQLGAACPLFVGVFVNEGVGTVSAITRKVGLNYAQLSGDESADMLRELRGIGFKAVRPVNVAQAEDDLRYYADTLPADARIPSLLLDAHQQGEYGGTGRTVGDDVAAFLAANVPRLMLAGGLTPDNVVSRIAAVRPWGVDTASGVEGATPGRKDAGKLRAFIAAALDA